MALTGRKINATTIVVQFVDFVKFLSFELIGVVNVDASRRRLIDRFFQMLTNPQCQTTADVIRKSFETTRILLSNILRGMNL